MDGWSIFPASAGVFLGEAHRVADSPHIPRIRGGVSPSRDAFVLVIGYSPHPRGCFHPFPVDRQGSDIFPASAGVFLISHKDIIYGRHIPRIRGGVSRGRRAILYSL